MMHRDYTCHTCMEPMKVTVFFHAYVTQNGPTPQACQTCGAVHTVHVDRIELKEPGKRVAKLSMEYDYPEYKPFRVGPYRVRFSNRNWGAGLWNWNGEYFYNGAIMAREGSIIAWQGLAGDMEHEKRMPYDLHAPMTGTPDDELPS